MSGQSASLTLEQTADLIARDAAEGRETVSLTRAQARAIYFVVFDVLQRDEPREHEPDDLVRLGIVQANVTGIGWPA
jgi:hypothetical protein